MSHDRGCPCGRESYEYNECKERNCMKNNRTMVNEKRYVRVSKSGGPKILTKQELESEIMIDDHDQYFELGREVEVKKTASVVPKDATYRNHSE